MSEPTRSYEVKVNVAVQDITEGQYRCLCEAVADAADGLFPGVDVFVSGRIVEDPA